MENDVSWSMPGSPPSVVCLICLKSTLNGEKCNKETNGDVLLYNDFLDFCIKYLKIDSVHADILKAREEDQSSATRSFCSGCKHIVRITLKTFTEWSALRTILLGNVKRLGLLITSTDGSSLKVENGVSFFREQFESKCLAKAQLIQPVVQLSSINHRHEKQNDWSSENNLVNEQDEQYGSHIYDVEDPSWSPSEPEDAGDSEGEKESSITERKIKKKISKSTRRTRSSTSIVKCENPAETENLLAPSITITDSDRIKRRGRKRKLAVQNPSDGPYRRPRSANSYNCSECSIKVRRRSEFLEHNIKEHEGLDLCEFLKCSVCHKTQANIIKLYNHLKSKHDSFEGKPVFCVHCTDVFTTQQLRDLHRRLDHPSCPHILCEVDDCSEKFIPVSDYNEHLKSHSSSNLLYYCEQCGRGFLGMRHCEVHKLYHMPKDNEGFHVCPIQECVKYNKYKNVSKLANHYNQKHLSKTEQLQLHRCEQCKKSPFFIFRKELLIHQKIHTKKIQCKFCKEILMGHNNLTVHQFNKHPDKFNGNMISSRRKKLEVCHSETAEPSKLLRNDDNFETALLRTCPYCLKSFLTFQDMEKHKSSVHNIHATPPPSQSQVQCEVCGLTLIKNQLPRHMICHNDPQLSCPYPPCTKKFRREENMIMHIKKVHDRKECDREFICDTCGKRYLTRGYLNRHVREQHIKPFPCHLCSKKFSTVGRFNEHLRASHTNEKFQCQWCPNEYGWLVKLKLHAKKKHPEQAHLLNTIYKHGMKPTTIEYPESMPMQVVQNDEEGNFPIAPESH